MRVEDPGPPGTAGVEDAAGEPLDWTATLGSTTLRAIAAAWLRYDRQCPLVTFERGLNWGDRPDVYAMTKDRMLLEIEIKVSLSDFRNDAKKWKWTRQNRGMVRHLPAYFYYLAPKALAEKIQPELPPGAGLLTIPNPGRSQAYTGLPEISCLVRARRNPMAVKVAVRDALELVKHQTGTLCSLAVAQAKHHRMANAPEALPSAPEPLAKGPQSLSDCHECLSNAPWPCGKHCESHPNPLHPSKGADTGEKGEGV